MLRLVCFLAAVAYCSASQMSLGDEGIKNFVYAHNTIRNKTGQSLPLLKWSSTLATYAAGVADACNGNHDPANKYGENMFGMWASSVNVGRLALQASASWGNEIIKVKPDWACIVVSGDDTCGHYSQMVWRDTTEFGCAISSCANNIYYVFCEYSPAGNIADYNYATQVWTAKPPY